MLVSVVMPCLNEEKTVGICVREALKVFKESGIDGEVIVVDNGSTDRSAEIALSEGAVVVYEPSRGYGSAYLRGFKEAKGEIIVMSDSDGTYPLHMIPEFIKPLRDGKADFVIGSRLRGKIHNGAMPWLHRHIGNPLLTKTLNLLFKTKISDAHCGMRAFRRDVLDCINPNTRGMEFASEMVIKAAKAGLRIEEVPVEYSPRLGGGTKLASFQDGWRHMRFMLLYKNAMLFITPGFFFLTLGAIFMLFSSSIRYHSMILGSFLAITGFQIISLGLYSKVYAALREMDRPDRVTSWLMHYNSLEYGLVLGLAIFIIGAGLGLKIFSGWVASGFAELQQVRSAVISSTLAIVGLQTMFTAIFLSILLLDRKY
jgi:glycosyltransferase involved in cell wall biosynthesis